MPAATIAICSGVARTSNWPIADCAVWGAFGRAGNTDRAARIGTVMSLRSKPNFSAWARSASAPSAMPMAPKAVLQEMRSALSTVVWSLGPHGRPSYVGSPTVVCGSGRFAGPGTTVSLVYLPLASAAAAVTSLNVDPGGYVSDSARSSIGWFGSLVSVSQACRCLVGSWSARAFGSYDGLVTRARMAPVVGLRATTAPLRPASPFIAAACAAGFRVSVTEPPRGWVPLSRSASRLTNSRLSLPARTGFSACSTPLAP